ncbi:MAG: hypothetical protein WKF47_11935 [Geodermatophilaceae bacterium]
MLAAERAQRHQTEHGRRTFVIEGHHDSAEQEIASALGDLTSLLASDQPGSKITSYVLSASRPTLDGLN